MFDVTTLSPPHSQYNRAIVRKSITSKIWAVHITHRGNQGITAFVFESGDHNKCQAVAAEINRYLNARARLRGEDV